jgi:uncharacterized protein (DUF1015 family)
MKNLGLATPQILLPNSKINMKKWTVIACDQYNSNIDYWQDVEKIVGNNPSTLRMILPEIYLEDEDDRQARIQETVMVMEDYVAGGVVEALPQGFILVERKLPEGTRSGLMGSIDLETYDYNPNKDTKVRPTEQTVLERIPPRVEIRKPALLESPHILVLLNDPDKSVIEPLVAKSKKLPTLYEFDLMKNGGNIKGSFIGEKEDIDGIYQRLEAVDAKTDILFSVGDGNHSLATAKTVWDEFKKDLSDEDKKDHPKRFALVEIINLYDDGLAFEPIHRVVFGIDSNKLIGDLIRIFNVKNMDAKIFFKRSSASKLVKTISGQSIDFIAKQKKGYIKIDAPANDLEAVNFQAVLDEYLIQNPEVKVEYIHGIDELERLCDEQNTTGFVLPKLNKNSFIDVLSNQGVLPKKCFSLGEADEKRFYLECRLLDKIADTDGNAEVRAADDYDHEV